MRQIGGTAGVGQPEAEARLRYFPMQIQEFPYNTRACISVLYLHVRGGSPRGAAAVETTEGRRWAGIECMFNNRDLRMECPENEGEKL